MLRWCFRKYGCKVMTINRYDYGKCPPNTFPAPKDIRQKKRNKSPLDPLANFTNTLHGDTCDISNRSEKPPSAAAHSLFRSRARSQLSPLTILNLTCFTSWLPQPPSSPSPGNNVPHFSAGWRSAQGGPVRGRLQNICLRRRL